MLAVLDDAIACFRKFIFAQDRKGKTLFHEAEEWILEENSDWLFSFETVCEVLDFNPDYVRKGLIRWKERRLGERRRAALYPLTPARKKNKEAISADRLEGAMQRLLRAGGE